MSDKHAYIIITEGAPESVRTQLDRFLTENGIKATIIDRPITIHEVTN